MNKRYVIIFLLVAVILTIASFLLISKTKMSYSKSEQSIGSSVFGDIHIDKVRAIKIIQPGLHSVLLRKNKAKWTVQNLYDYPADVGKISDFIQELTDLKVIQNVRISNPDSLKELNLLAPSLNNKESATEIQLFGTENKPLHSLLIGKNRVATDPQTGKQISIGRYVKVAMQNDVILTDEIFTEISYKAKNWLNNKDISINNIQAIKQIKNSKTAWKLTRNNSKENFKLNSSPKEASVDDQRIRAIADTLNNMQFDSIAKPGLPPSETGLNSQTTIVVSTFDGSQYKIMIGKTFNKDYFVKLRMSSKNQLSGLNRQQILCQKWTYLVSANRIEPMLLSKNELKKQRNKKTPANIYPLPIG